MTFGADILVEERVGAWGAARSFGMAIMIWPFGQGETTGHMASLTMVAGDGRAGSAISLVVPGIRSGSVVAVQVLLGNG